MDEEKLGIEKLKEALGGIINFGESLAEALEDNKINWKEAISLIAGSFSDFKTMFLSFSEVKAEFLDLDEAEREELVSYFEEEFNLDEKDVENKIEKGIELLDKLIAFVSLF